MTRTNLGDLFEQPSDDLAMIDVRDWERPWPRTYRELATETDAVAAALTARGIARGSAIGIIAENRSEYLTTYLGVLRAGFTAVPMNAKFPSRTVAHVIDDAGIVLTFCDEGRRELLPAGAPAVVFGDPGPAGFGAFISGDHAPFAVVETGPDDFAVILYTSGSTGMPKGVPLTHRAQRWLLDNRVANTRGVPPDRALIVAPLAHMNALGKTTFSLAARGVFVLLPRFDAKQYIRAAQRFDCENLSGVPAMMAMVLRERETLQSCDLSRIRSINMGSAPTAEKLWLDVQRAFPQALLINGYGTTESGFGMFGSSGQSVPRGSCGRQQPGFDLRLVDDAGNDAVEGTLWVRSPANAAGYLHRPEETRRAFMPDGWYVTGDRFRRDGDGVYWFVGRDDDMFVCGGENVFPVEVESVIDRHPDVEQSSVVAVPDEVKGEKPFAFVVLRPGATASEDDIKQFVLANAPAYQHPRMVEFLDALPTAGPGKIDRKALSLRAQQLWSERSATLAV